MEAEVFEQHRPLLFSIAYRMLGTATDAEDVLQDAYVRMLERPSTAIERPKDFLATVVARLCLNRLSATRTKRELYVGPWLPEPIVTDPPAEPVSPLDNVMLGESVSTAFLVLLESLSPAERAVFLLHEVFGYTHSQIASMLEKSESACRQLFSRARRHIVENRPRFTATPAQHERLLEGFFRAVGAGDVESFLELLAEDVTMVPDGGGQAGAAINVLRGPEPVAKFIFGTYRLASPRDLRFAVVALNGQRAVVARMPDGRPFFVMFVYSADGVVQLIHVIAGKKLASLPSLDEAHESPIPITRTE